MEMRINKQEVLKYMRKNKIETQKELAKMMGITESQVSLMLTELYNPIRTNVSKLSEVLKVSPSELIKINTNEKSFSRFDYKTNHFVEVKDVTSNNSYKVLETFAGAGGLALGLEKAGFITVGAIELDKHASETLRTNRPNWNVIEANIEDVVEVGVKNYVDICDIDVLSGGYPCQSFSYAGKRQGLSDIRGTLFYSFSKIIEEVKPKMFIAENVKGMVNHDQGKTLETMIQVFEKNGYQIHWNVLNAWDYDVAQKRERIVIIGIRNDLVSQQKYEFAFPLAQTYKPVLKDVLADVPESASTEYSNAKKEIMEIVPPGGCWVNLPEEIAREYLGKSWYSGGGKRGMARRLSWDEPSLTLTTSPSQKQTERCHPSETRPFTVREYARIQSFPDNWLFSGATTAQYKQIGNAVPVNLATYVGKAVIRYLNQF